MLTESLAQHLALLATRAPSLHNSQPWRLVVTKDGLDVRADRERQLGVIDPMGRQLLMKASWPTQATSCLSTDAPLA